MTRPTRTKFCGAKTIVRIESQPRQSVQCMNPPDHSGPHVDVVLDSDDNAVRYRWTDQEATQA